jgi:L-amino acid N-acyltransferase YncA
VGVRAAHPADAETIAAIHAQGIEDRTATFETRPMDPAAISDAIAHWALYLVFERDGEVLGFAKINPYEDRSSYYDGIAEATIYVERSARGEGIGSALLNGLAEAAEGRGLHKLTAKVFAENEASLALCEACGFRRVGTHHRHGRLDGVWRDVVVLERSL